MCTSSVHKVLNYLTEIKRIIINSKFLSFTIVGFSKLFILIVKRTETNLNDLLFRVQGFYTIRIAQCFNVVPSVPYFDEPSGPEI